MTKAKDHEDIPEIPEDATPEKIEALNGIIEEIKTNNAQIDLDNAKLERMKQKIRIQPRNNDEVDSNNEIALVKLNNYREEGQTSHLPLTSQKTTSAPMKMDSTVNANSPVPAEGEADAEAETQFQPDKIPLKIPLVRPDSCESGSCIVYHSEAQYQVRKYLIDQARKTFKELEKAVTNDLLAHSYQRTKMLEERFEETLVRNQGFGRGHMFADNNVKIVFKTFLKE